MLTVLSKLFIKDRKNYSDPSVRRSYGVLCGGMGIFFNVVLFVFKFIAGSLSTSVAVTADAFNNLSDAGSSIVTMIGFRLSGHKPDNQHPYGHGRIEYISGLIVSMIIILMGFELLMSSVKKIASPEPTEFSVISIIILSVSILVKAYMYFYNLVTSRKISSVAMKATALDSLTDCAATLAVLASLLAGKFFGIQIDGWCGAAVSLFVIYSGLTSAKETISPLLGQPPEKEFVDSIEKTVLAHEGVLGVHDIVVHDYGPGRKMTSLHAEVPADGNILDIHDMIDNIENELREKFECEAVVHMDPVLVNDEETNRLKAKVKEIVKNIDPELMIHDFRIVSGVTHTNVIFDVVVPFKFKLTDSELIETIENILNENADTVYKTVIKIDRSFV